MDYTKIVFSATDEPYWSTNKEVIEVARSKSENPNVNRFSVFDPSRCVVFRIHEYIYDRKIISAAKQIVGEIKFECEKWKTPENFSKQQVDLLNELGKATDVLIHVEARGPNTH